MKYKKELIIFSIFLLIFIIDSLCVCFIPNLSNTELKIISFVQSVHSSVPLQVPEFITDFGHGLSRDYIILGVIILFLFFRNYKSLMIFFAAQPVAYWLYSGIKLVFERPRPPVEYRLIEISNYSYPSGHSILSVVTYGLLIYFVWKYIKNTIIRNIITTILSIIILSVCFTRIWLGVHFPTDVLGGFSLGICLICMCVIIDKTFTKNSQNLVHSKTIEEKENVSIS